MRVTLSLVAGTLGACREKGCDKEALLYGFCADHERAALEDFYDNALRLGFASPDIPLCFTSYLQYVEYVVTSLAGVQSASTRRVEICRDCNPEFKAQMMRESRCEHHETVFVRRPERKGGGGDVVGVAIDSARKSTTAAWQAAMLGASGEVVCLPPHYAIDATLERLDKLPKFKRVRKKKK